MMKNFTFPSLLFLLFSISVFSQNTNLVTNEGINSLIHRENIGKIVFMDKNIAIDQSGFQTSDFLKEFVTKENADLNIRILLGNSLTNYLHFLSPDLSVDELVKNGNFQFTFLVDDKKIYVENLNVGAGTTESKNQKTLYRIPLYSSTNEDSWGRFLWNRFLGNGGEEALSQGEHILKIEIRPYLKLTEVLKGEIIAKGQLKIIVPEIKVDENLVKIQPIKPLKDWKISKEKIDISTIEELNRKILNKTFKNITSIVVIENNQLLLEEYFNEANRNTLHDTRSVGKSFASTLLGIAIKDGFIKNEDQTLNQFYDLTKFENYSKEKEKVTLKSLLTMSSSFDGSDQDSDSPGNEENMYPTKNWVEFTLNLPIDDSKIKEKRWDYFTAGVVVLGDVLHQSVPNGLEKYADKKLFQPLGITDYKWQFTPQNVANTAGSLQMRSIDFAKFGQLYQNKGSWKNKQILTKDWVEKSLSHQISISEDEFYGYLFWNKTFVVNGKNHEVYYSSGNGGNRIIIFKDQPLVFVITATAYNTPFGHKQVEKIVQDYLIPAVVN